MPRLLSAPWRNLGQMLPLPLHQSLDSGSGRIPARHMRNARLPKKERLGVVMRVTDLAFQPPDFVLVRGVRDAREPVGRGDDLERRRTDPEMIVDHHVAKLVILSAAD